MLWNNRVSLHSYYSLELQNLPTLKLGFIVIQSSLILQIQHRLVISLRALAKLKWLPLRGRLNSVTTGRFQESDFHGPLCGDKSEEKTLTWRPLRDIQHIIVNVDWSSISSRSTFKRCGANGAQSSLRPNKNFVRFSYLLRSTAIWPTKMDCHLLLTLLPQ